MSCLENYPQQSNERVNKEDNITCEVTEELRDENDISLEPIIKKRQETDTTYDEGEFENSNSSEKKNSKKERISKKENKKANTIETEESGR